MRHQLTFIFIYLVLLSIWIINIQAFHSIYRHTSSLRSSLRSKKILSIVQMSNERYSIPNQPQRFANAKKDNNERYLNIESVYNPSNVKDKVVLVTGGNRGLGLAIARELVAQGAKVIITTRQPLSGNAIPGVIQVVDGVDVTDNNLANNLVHKLNGQKIDILINNAGYFYEPVETIESLNYEEQMKMIDICALGPLRITSALVNAKLLGKEAKVAMITSQGGSIQWRTTQNPEGYDYGHHMSKAAANMMSVLLAQELKSKGICVVILHPVSSQ